MLAVAILAAPACGGGDEEAEVTGEPTAESVAASPTSVLASTPTVVSRTQSHASRRLCRLP